MPSLGLRIGVGGFGVGVGTRGLSIGTPILSQSIGLSGFRTTLGVPGLAHISVNPLRPSGTLGLGPLRLNLSRHPGVGISTGLISLGVTSRPLAWMDVMGLSIAIPGALPRQTRPWHEDVDDQWRQYYQRRPPEISEQLHDLIIEVEEGARRQAFAAAPTPAHATVPLGTLSPRDVRNHHRQVRRQARSGIPLRSRGRRREALEKANVSHDEWRADEQRRLREEQERTQQLIDRAFNAWQSGEPLASAIVANATLAVTGLAGFVTSATEDEITVVVLAPGIDAVHPQGPSLTPSGYATVKKRSRATRQALHTELVGATVVPVVQAVVSSTHTIPTIRVAVALPDDGDLADCATVASFRHRRSEHLPTQADDLGPWMSGRALGRAQRLGDVIPESFLGNPTAPAFAVGATGPDDLRSPVFWIELDALLEELRTSPRPAAPATRTKPTTTTPATAAGSGRARRQHPVATPEIPNKPDPTAIDLEIELLYTLGDLYGDLDDVEAQTLVEQAIELLEHPAVVDLSPEDVGQLAARAAQVAFASGLTSAVAKIHEVVEVLPSPVGEQLRDCLAEAQRVGHKESFLTLGRNARQAVENADTAGLVDVVALLAQLIPSIGRGSCGDVDVVVEELANGLMGAGRSDLLERLVAATTSTPQDVQRQIVPKLSAVGDLLIACDTVLAFVARNPGHRQAGLAQALDLDALLVRRICWYSAHFGRLQRERQGNSYALTVPDAT